jgi:anhydro-N-acetylmuramic acid kinase
VLHRPDKALTVQLGDGALLAQETGLPVVFDMRANDMAHGGQGAPLAPAYHAALARSLPGICAAFRSASSISAGSRTSPSCRRRAIRWPSIPDPATR